MCPDKNPELRRPSEAEMSLLTRLLSGDFPGAPMLRRQLADLCVDPIDDDGSLRLRPTASTVPAAVSRRIPVEARYPDVDGVFVHVLMHVVGGVLDELEVYREDSGPVLLAPSESATMELEP